MTEPRVEHSPHRIARLAGALYLLQMATAIFGESFVRGSLIVPGDATRTALNIVHSEGLFRVSIATDILTYTLVLLLVWTLYVLLKPVNRNLALLATLLRAIELAIHYGATVFSLVALTYVTGVDQLPGFERAELDSLARMALKTQGASLKLGFVLTGLGSAVFAHLLMRSGYVPKLLGGWGIFASLLLSGYAVADIVYPPLVAAWFIWMIPMFFWEVGAGLWLLVKGAGSGTRRASVA